MTRASEGAPIRIVMTTVASQSVTAMAGRLRKMGHAVATQAVVGTEAAGGADAWLVDAAVLATPASLPPPIGSAAAGPGCLVLVGRPPAGWRRPAAWHAELAFVREDAADAEVDALLAGLAARQAAGARLARLQRDCDDLQLALEDARAEVTALGDQLSHELQAALTHVASAAEVLEGRVGQQLGTADGEHLRRIREAARQAHGLVRDLALLGRVRMGRAQAAEVDLGAVVRELAAELTPAGRALDWRIGPLPTVAGDPGLLALALRHLMANAVKFTRQVARAQVEVTAQPDAGGWAVEVRDNGVGFDPDAAARLFRPLQRLHPAHAFEGNGLGLAMVKAVAERHEGSVTARMPPEGGAVFTLHLPGSSPVEPHEPAPAPPPEPSTAPPARGAAAPAGPALRILVVDDDDWVLGTLRALLERDGHAVDTLHGGEAALARLAQADADYDVVVTDWSMPVVEGPQVALAARLARPAVHTIVLTGRRPDAPGSLPPGVDQVLGKPVRGSELRQALARAGGAATGGSPTHL